MSDEFYGFDDDDFDGCERKIADVREEIALITVLAGLCVACATDVEDYGPKLCRILAREQAALAELLRGWRE